MYILGICSSCGTSRICPAWSPSEHQLTPALSPFRARVRSHVVRKRLFIVLMTAAHISPNIFSLRNFLSNIHRLFLTVHITSFILFIHHIHAYIYIFYLHVLFTLSLLRIFMAGWLPSVPCVPYTRAGAVNAWLGSARGDLKHLDLWDQLDLVVKCQL